MKIETIILLFFITFLLIPISAGSIPPDPTNLTNTTGNFWVNHTWELGGGAGEETRYLITGAEDATFDGYNWTGSAWSSDSDIVSGLTTVGTRSSPEAFQMDSTWYLISGNAGGTFTGYNWTGSAWQVDSDIVSGLIDVGDQSKLAVFQMESIWYCITGELYGEFYGYNWTGSTWQSDSDITDGLLDVGYYSYPEVFQKDGTWHLFSPNGLCTKFFAYDWNGTGWESNATLVSGLVDDIGTLPDPTIFQIDSTWYLILGEDAGIFYGYNWTGSTWQSDSDITGGLDDVGEASAPDVFIMSELDNETDSYSVLVNGVWHNATTDLFYNDTYSAHAWQNITVYAYNSSGAGNLSENSISQNTQIPNNVPVLSGVSASYNLYDNETLTIDANHTDLDSDTITYSDNASEWDINSTTGEVSWVLDGGDVAGSPYSYRITINDGYGGTDYQDFTVTINKSIYPLKITLVSFSPSPLNTNYTGATVISYMVSSSEPLNYSSIAFLYGLNYTVTGDMHNYVATPHNTIAFEGIYRAPNRNITPYLTWEFNDTITEGNVWKWGGGDNNSWWIVKNQINETHTYVNVTGVTQHILPSSFYLQKLAMYNAPKTPFEVNRQQGLIFKMWNVEQLRDRNFNYFANLYFDSSWESTLPTYPIEMGFCNNSYDPAVDDIDTCLNCTKIGEWDGNRWVNHSWVPGANAAYAYPLIINGSQYTEPVPDEINYIWLRSNALSSKSYVLNATDSDPGITNITFAQTETFWTYNELNGVTSPAAYTPSFFTTFVRNDEELLHHLYIADINGVWKHSEIFNESIGISSVPVPAVSFEYFNVTCDGYYHDYEMDATYDQGTIGVGMYCPADPDSTTVSHNLTLHYYPNLTLAGVINSTFTTNGDEDVEIEFNTAPYYSPDTLYTLKCVSQDGDDNVATKWLVSYFALDADGNQGWVKDDKLLFWGMNDIPTLYAEVSNSSLISYDGGSDIYTMHVPFFKSKANDTFLFNETVHLESLNNEDVAYFRFTGRVLFDYATITGWDTVEDSTAPITDTYRGYVYSLSRTCGNITNSNFSYLGSDLYRQEGLNFVGNSHPYLIHNSTFSHNGEGPIFEECTNFTISNCTISDNLNVGIGVYFSSDFIIENNIMSSNAGRSISVYEGFNNTIRYNDISDSGDYGIRFWSGSGNNTCTGNDITTSASYDYYYSGASFGNYLIDPASSTNLIRVTGTSSLNIENTDNMAFSEDSLATSYAYLTNFSMYVTGTSQTFDITQRDMSIWPTTDRVKISNLVWNSKVTFDSDSDVVNNPTWFNITNGAWADSEVHVYRDNILYDNESAEGNGSISYYYENTFLGAPHFEFRITLIPTPLLFNVFLLLVILTVGLTGYSILINDTTNFTHIIVGFLSAILWFILGYQSYIGIGFEHTITDSVYSAGVLLWAEDIIKVTIYQYAWMGMLFIVIGVIMVLYSIVQAYNANKDIIEELEGEKKDDY